MLKTSWIHITAVLILGLLLAQTGLSFAKSLGVNEDSWLQDVEKRNSWWSKKSVNEYGPVEQDDYYKNHDLTSKGTGLTTRSSTELYSCYVETCVPDFISCAKRSRTQKSFTSCKLDHRLCAINCWTLVSGNVPGL
ncbi:uncharacterized protein LOC121375926 isoform X1 [Gigantopelta aegis]|uniref:uncharacterized protein LOC121375926 isoform X1 n=1 Tax=Gigantopelta aegis TaxID=1735272 RepID=UPI001B88B29F|nr:uncharacterized protein LOC121375926 isoform X1 [Gigantopelta aegis]